MKSPESGARPNLSKNPPHSIHKINTKGYGVIGVTAFLRKLMRFLRKKELIWWYTNIIYYYYCVTFLWYSYSFHCNAGLARALQFWNNVVQRLTLGSVTYCNGNSRFFQFYEVILELQSWLWMLFLCTADSWNILLLSLRSIFCQHTILQSWLN